MEDRNMAWFYAPSPIASIQRVAKPSRAHTNALDPTLLECGCPDAPRRGEVPDDAGYLCPFWSGWTKQTQNDRPPPPGAPATTLGLRCPVTLGQEECGPGGCPSTGWKRRPGIWAWGIGDRKTEREERAAMLIGMAWSGVRSAPSCIPINGYLPEGRGTGRIFPFKIRGYNWEPSPTA